MCKGIAYGLRRFMQTCSFDFDILSPKLDQLNFLNENKKGLKQISDIMHLAKMRTHIGS